MNGPLNQGALAAAVRSGTPTLGTFIGTAVTAEFGRARTFGASR